MLYTEGEGRKSAGGIKQTGCHPCSCTFAASIMISPLRYVFMSGVLIVLGLGLLDMLKNFEENGCEMTYMFEYPEYIVSFMELA